MGPRLIWRDICRSIRGAVAFRRYLRARDAVDIALGRFEASSSTVMVGRPCRYVIRIANISAKVWDVTVILQISSMCAAQVPAQPSASFAKRCTVLPRRATEIECHYDWRTAAVFMLDSVVSPPDGCRTGEIGTLQRYLVRAMLCDHTGDPLDRLSIYQELQG
jgi:hypothetical protein